MGGTALFAVQGPEVRDSSDRIGLLRTLVMQRRTDHAISST